MSSGTGPCADLCDNPVAMTAPNYSSGNLTSGERCFESTGSHQGYVCGNMMSRTLTINDATEAVCNGSGQNNLGAKRNGGYCFQITAGEPPYAYFGTF
jgi:hypothetical protein